MSKWCTINCSLSTVVVEVEDPGRVYIEEFSEVSLSCEIYGYPRDSSSPVWTSSVWTSDELQSGRFTTTVTNTGLLNSSSISTTERIVSQLTIFCASERDSGEYTCSVQGNSTTVTLTIVEGISRELFTLCLLCYLVSLPFLEIAEPIQNKCDCGKPIYIFSYYLPFHKALYFTWQEL